MLSHHAQFSVSELIRLGIKRRFSSDEHSGAMFIVVEAAQEFSRIQKVGSFHSLYPRERDWAKTLRGRVRMLTQPCLRCDRGALQAKQRGWAEKKISEENHRVSVSAMQTTRAIRRIQMWSKPCRNRYSVGIIDGPRQITQTKRRVRWAKVVTEQIFTITPYRKAQIERVCVCVCVRERNRKTRKDEVGAVNTRV